MKTLFVPYELAVIAKEKGFNEPCLFCYRGEFDLYCHSLGGYLEDVEFKANSDFKDYLVNERKPNYWISAPLYQQIVDWFREKHFLHIAVNIDGIYEKGNDTETFFYDFSINERWREGDGSYIERLFFVNLNSIKRFESLLRKNKNFTGLSYFPTSTTTPILNTYSINF